jgi:hypothetical protein
LKVNWLRNNQATKRRLNSCSRPARADLVTWLLWIMEQTTESRGNYF